MALPLLKLPPEILLQILSNLSIKPLLRFAQTSHYARILAHTNFRALSLTVCPSHRTSWHSKLFFAPHKPAHSLHAAIQIPHAWDFDYPTLLTFHNKITASIVSRYASTLRTLELTLWTLSPTIAQALTTLPALRDLSIRLETTHAMSRIYTSLQRRDECAAWTLLASNPSWTHVLRTLRIEGAEIGAAQLGGLIEGAMRLRDLSLSSCGMLTGSIWGCAGLRRLQQLRVTDCANVHVDATAVGGNKQITQTAGTSTYHSMLVRAAESDLRCSVAQRCVDCANLGCATQALDLHGCNGLDGEVLEQWNRDVWRVPVFVAPRPRGLMKENLLIEVDPDYMNETV
ncbi:hypothetical protein C7974DRAFT_231608 [Boeremia exigua]|uniref:uncharacterized protein n=1 Tax=Boeremia exigua TaxID=749465 RepID=UPI001E8E3AD2|nr:uncharacterized protein C7974DRAFT_231608 [Boeremia exigua]KAH6620339.1 hypothetical protein C7974DRAFT_231608 [Boeremia exigua]